MGDIKFKGSVTKNNNEKVKTLNDGLSHQALTCTPCGCDPCLGLHTTISATDGTVLGFYFTGTGPYTLVVEDYDTALANVKALKAAR